jgi:hypothetical protein
MRLEELDSSNRFSDPAQDGKCLVALTDQASRSILVLDAAVEDWNHEHAVHWSWAPCPENGFEGAAADLGWGCPSDVKLRFNKLHDCLCMLVVDSRGLVAIIGYTEQATKLWSANIAGNLHAAELLPDGNIAVAASHGNFVRLYTASQGATSGTYVEHLLPGGHGVLWDPQHALLWAVGDEYLTAFSIEGSASAPILKEHLDLRSDLPSLYGHDLSPVYGNPDLLWVTTNGGVYQYQKSSRTWSESFELSEHVQHKMVKSVGNFPNGLIVQAKPRTGSLYEWTTDTVDCTSLEAGARKLVRTGSAIYKARVWIANYN